MKWNNIRNLLETGVIKRAAYANNRSCSFCINDKGVLQKRRPDKSIWEGNRALPDYDDADFVITDRW